MTRRFLAASIALLLSGNMAFAADGEREAFIDDYCMDCHNLDDFAGSLAFDLVEQDALHVDAEVWEKVIRKLKGGMMPPPGQDRPQEHVIHEFVVDLEDSIDTYAAANPHPGAPLLRRLNRTEYQNAVRDLLDLPFDTSSLMPADDSSGGFDNVANVLSISPVLLEAYVSTASQVSRLAIGDLDTIPTSVSYRGDGQSQAHQKDGLPLGTRGGVNATHLFPLDAEYEISVARSGGASAFSLGTYGDEDPVEIAINGERVALFEPGERTSIRMAMPAGLHTLEAAFIPMTPGLGVDDLHTVWASSTGVNGITIRGPLEPSGRGDTASRRRIFSCYPQNNDEESACAEEILSGLASRAFRRPVTDESLNILMAFYQDGRTQGDFDTGIQYGLTRILVDPQFIFRFEEEGTNLPEGTVYAVDDYELASRLSFFVWSSIPDDRLYELAEAGRLSEPEVLAAEVERMLADEKAASLVDNFAMQWLSLKKLDSANPVSLDFDGALRDAMSRETRMLFDHVLKQDAPITEFIGADYTFLNERLARHYGIPGIRGSHFRQVELTEGTRRGLLGHASILTITSAPNRTSPVIRGTWIMENILGTPPPEPPPGVETNLEVSVQGSTVAMSIREQLEVHRADPSCSSCHNVIDPLGFSLENFNEIGQFRTHTSGEPVNSASRLWDGTELEGANSLYEALIEREDLFVEAFIEKLMTYALGRRLDYTDMPAVREVRDQAAESEYRLSAIVQAITDTDAFRMRQKADTQTDVALGLDQQN